MIRSRAAAIAVGSLLLAGCTSSADDDDPAAASSTPSSAPSTSAPRAPMDDVHDDERAVPFPSTAPVGARSVADLTVAVMTAYTDHGADEQLWFDRLAPYLSPEARAAYATVDPLLVPAALLVGQPVVLDEGAYLASAQQNTNAGLYTVLFSRADDGTWQVERIEPPTAERPA